MRASDMKVLKKSISDRNFISYAATRAKYIYSLNNFSSRRIIISVDSLLTVLYRKSFSVCATFIKKYLYDHFTHHTMESA